MKLTLFLSLLLISAFSASAQHIPADQIKDAKGGVISIQPIFHASVVFTWGGKTIYVDPSGGANAYNGIAPADIVLITDIHQDHLDFETLAAIKVSKAIFIVPQAVADKMNGKIKANIVVLNNDGSTTQQGITVSAIPMYNLPQDEKAMHPKGRGNGYILNLGGKKIYLSGDTDDTPEMRELKDIDIAFVCMNPPYTMDIMKAANVVLEFRPKIVYPYHYRGKDGLNDVAAFKKMVNKQNAGIDVRLRDWYVKY